MLVQITRTIPLRRTILQFSQIRLTLVLTFMAGSLCDENPTTLGAGGIGHYTFPEKFLNIIALSR